MCQPPVVLDPAHNNLHVTQAEAVTVIELLHQGLVQVKVVGS